MSLKDKIATICREMYGADGVDYSELAEQRLAVRFFSTWLMLRGIILITEKSNFFSIFVKTYTAAGYGTLPICMAKTQYSLSTDAAAKVIYLLQPFSLSDVLVTVQQYSHNVFVLTMAGSSNWIQSSCSRCTRCCRCRLHLPYLWRHHDRARSTNPPWILWCGHGPSDRPRHRPLLD